MPVSPCPAECAGLAGRRSRTRESRFPRRFLVAVLLVGSLAFAGWLLLQGGRGARPHLSSAPPAPSTTPAGHSASARARVGPARLRAVATKQLAAALQDAAAAPLGTGVVLAGGLTPSDTSSDAVILVGPHGDRLLARLPGARHDAAAAGLAGAVYLFGGGDGVRQLDQILRIDRRGRVTVAGRLPAPSSDQVAATIRGNGLRRRRLHRHPLARHDRRLATGWSGTRRRHTCRRRFATPPSPRRTGGS